MKIQVEISNLKYQETTSFLFREWYFDCLRSRQELLIFHEHENFRMALSLDLQHFQMATGPLCWLQKRHRVEHDDFYIYAVKPGAIPRTVHHFRRTVGCQFPTFAMHGLTTHFIKSTRNSWKHA